MVSCGANHTVVSSEEGHVYTFGAGECGQGLGDIKDKDSPALEYMSWRENKSH